MKITPKKNTLQWLDSNEMNAWLSISSYMLKKFRREKLVAFDKRGNKYYYNATEAKAMLESSLFREHI